MRNNDITSTVTAEAGTNLIVNTAGGDIYVIAADTVDPDWRRRAGGFRRYRGRRRDA